MRTHIAFAAALLLAGCSDATTAPPGSAAFQSNPCLPASVVVLDAAQTTRLDCSNGGATARLAGGGASYLIVPSFATGQVQPVLVEYNLASGSLAPSAAMTARAPLRVQRVPAGGVAATAGALPPFRPNPAQQAADLLLLRHAKRLAETRVPGGLPGTSFVLGPRTPPAPGSIRSFKVRSTLSTTAPAWKTVAAQLDYVGTSILVYVDTLAPANGFTAPQLQSLGQYFDQVMYPIDTLAFGQPSDVDQNGRVIMLLSPVVNADTPAATCTSQGFVGGFFDAEDFNGASDPNSNQGEVFYSIVPDPLATVSCAHSLAQLELDVPSIFLHELQHLINYSQHVVIAGGVEGSSWLDEGLSLAAEELGALHYEQQCPPPSCRTDPAQLFPDSAEGFVQNFLYDSYEYALLPDTATITLSDDAELGFSWRGGAWLLARYLADQNGGNTFFRQLEHGPSDGVADIEHTTGRTFPALFADFGLALYTDSLPGLPRATAPAADRFTSRNLKQLWARLYATSGPSADIPLPEPVQLFAVTADTTTAIMYPGTTTYFRLDTPATADTVAIRFAAPEGVPFPAALQPQLAIFRLPPGQ